MSQQSQMSPKSLNNFQTIISAGKGNSVSLVPQGQALRVFAKISAPSLRFGQYFSEKPCRTGTQN